MPPEWFDRQQSREREVFLRDLRHEPAADRAGLLREFDAWQASEWQAMSCEGEPSGTDGAWGG